MANSVRIIGLTGGIGTGKSTAAKYLIEHGFKHIDADAISRSITADGSPMLKVLNDVFGPDGEYGVAGHQILRSPDSLNRQALAQIVFTDQARREKLDEIMIKVIVEEIDRQIAEYKAMDDGACVLLDAPTLFENHLEDRCDSVIVIVADKDVRISRVCERDGMTAQQVQDRINNQMSDEEKIAKSDIVVDNSGDLNYLINQLEKIIANFYKKD
ncbi:MAG: dephospho-CoA kinase [Eubacterium sp.]|nr:dephospho-CoA kinase [Candidatus Colimonas fimequi]